MSFYTSLSGLQAAQTELSSIAHNLANVSTNGFKKSRTEFADVIASSPTSDPTLTIGIGTVVKSNRQQFSQGNLVQSQSALDLAISGDGFFAIKPALDGSDINFTRNGAFSVDANRYVVDSQGAHLQVFPVDGSGAVVVSGLNSTISLRLPATTGTPKPTANVALAVNVPASASLPTVPFDRFDPTSYNGSAQTTIYDAAGNAQSLVTYYRRETLPSAGNNNSTWSVHTFVGNQELLIGGAAGGFTASFNATGALTQPTTPIQFDGFIPAASPTAQQITIDFASSTQSSNPFNVAAATQDGQAIGQIQGVTVDEKGLVKAAFSNGTTQVLGKIAIAKFSNPAGLRQLGDSNWSSTGISGEASLGEPGKNGFGGLLTGTIERSNVDITEELVALIAAQRNFQANSKALETDKQISQTILNIQ